MGSRRSSQPADAQRAIVRRLPTHGLGVSLTFRIRSLGLHSASNWSRFSCALDRTRGAASALPPYGVDA